MNTFSTVQKVKKTDHSQRGTSLFRGHPIGVGRDKMKLENLEQLLGFKKMKNHCFRNGKSLKRLFKIQMYGIAQTG